MLTAAGVEASQAPLIGHHQLTVGLLSRNLLSLNARIGYLRRGTCPRGRAHCSASPTWRPSRPNATRR